MRTALKTFTRKPKQHINIQKGDQLYHNQEKNENNCRGAIHTQRNDKNVPANAGEEEGKGTLLLYD